MNSCGMTFRFTNMLALLAIALLAACSGSPKATQKVDTLNLKNESPRSEAFVPGAILTIAPTNIPTLTMTPIEPTSTVVPTATLTERPTAAVTKLADTPTSTPSEIPTATATTTPTDTPTEQTVGSACPQGCLQQSPGCEIKGNINNEGVKIYHMPYQNFYNQTKISPEKGERWFCTPAEAEANGWRPSQR